MLIFWRIKVIRTSFIFRFVKLVGLLTFPILLTGCGSLVYHQVQKGETLYSISWRYHQNYHDVAKWNDIEAPYIIHSGQWLRVVPPTSNKKDVKLVQAPVRDISPEQEKPRHDPSPVAKVEQASTREVAPSVVKKVVGEEDKSSVTSAPVKRDKTTETMLSSRAPITWRWPVEGKVIETYNANRPGKKGIAIGGQRGTLVRATAAGKVVYSGDSLKGYGNLIIIKHNEKYLSAYGHNQTLLVKEGDVVSAGEAIARMGDTEASRVKLHFEIRVDGKAVNPLRYLPKRSS